MIAIFNKWLRDLFQDTRYGARMLAKSPGFTLIAVLTIALGIGACTAIFSVVRAQALAPLPYPDANRVVQLWRGSGQEFATWPWSAADYLDVHEQCATLAESGAYRPERLNLGGERPEALEGITCTPGVLRALGRQPALGRWFGDDDARPGAPLVAILSHASWTRRFNADPTLVGRAIRLNGQDCTVVGIMPSDFEFYCPWTGARAAAIWTPLRLSRQNASRETHDLLAVGRLRPDATIASANAELAVVASRLAAAYPESDRSAVFHLRSLATELTEGALQRFRLVIAAVVLVLFVACANLATMFLARGASRQTEYAVRLSLGASRWHLVRMALIESLVVSFIGAAAGLFFNWNAAGLLAKLFPATTAHGVPIAIDPLVLGCSLFLALAAAFAAGLPPALAAANSQVVTTIKQGGGTIAGSRTRHHFLQHLVSGQVGAVVVLVNTALLLLAAFRVALAANQPLSSDFVLAASVTARGANYAGRDARAALWNRVLERVRMLPGVTTAGVTDKLPLRGGNNTNFLLEGEPSDPRSEGHEAEISFVTPDYFSAMGIARLKGRAFESADGSRDTLGIIVNRALAERFWPGRDPLGQQVRGDGSKPWFTARVVGVVENVRQWDIGDPSGPEIYFPYAWQSPATAHLVVRSTFDAHSLAPALRRELAAVDPDLALADPITMADLVNDETRESRTLLWLINAFMAVTLLMAAIGIYGTLALQTRQRTREIGVRVALGAIGPDVAGLVFRQAVPWVVAGGGVGLLASVCVNYGLRAMFAEISLLNPLYYLSGCVAIVLVIALAAWLPARRAARLDPMQALRAE